MKLYLKFAITLRVLTEKCPISVSLSKCRDRIIFILQIMLQKAIYCTLNRFYYRTKCNRVEAFSSCLVSFGFGEADF